MILDRFFSKVEFVGYCWVWTGAKKVGKNALPYGFFGVNGKNQLAHRFAYRQFVGPIPSGLYVLHKCDNPSCVNPVHLFLGTAKDNAQDCVSKGRKYRPTHCPQGHEHTEENSIKRPTRNGRECRACVLHRDTVRNRGGARTREWRERTGKR